MSERLVIQASRGNTRCSIMSASEMCHSTAPRTKHSRRERSGRVDATEIRMNTK